MVDSVITFTPSEVSSYYAVRVPHLKQRHAAQWRCACPIHKGDRDSFSVESDTGRWSCFSTCGRGGDVIELEEALTGADFKAAKAEVFKIIGRPPTPNGNHSRGRIAETYDYRDEDENLLYQVVRMDPKGFRQRRPDGNGGWDWSLKGVRLVLYRLPELLKQMADRPDTGVFICEGEKDVHALELLGLPATTNCMGAGKWRPEYSEALRSRRVVILPDNDEPGRKHAAAVAADLLRVGCEVRIIEFPGLPAKGDVSDWIAKGGTVGELRKLYGAHSALTEDNLAELRARWSLADKEPHQARAAAGSMIVTRRLSDINAKPVCWLWPERIARGKVTMIAGNPGLGKSQITASIASIVTTGGYWPVDGGRCTSGDMVFLAAEDDPADTLRPRLEAAGADLRRVHAMDSVIAEPTGDGQPQNRAFSLQRDVQALSAKLAELGDVAAVIIDPITAYLGIVDSPQC